MALKFVFNDDSGEKVFSLVNKIGIAFQLEENEIMQDFDLLLIGAADLKLRF
jgi:hypothetical protein